MADAESSQPERKRPRLQSPEEEKHFVNHPTLYFDDGNVILGAGRTLFCVHRSLLSKHSTVFRDIFEQTQARFRGHLHVEMEETAEEVEALVNVIYDGVRFDVEALTVETFPLLANVLRMATKYKVDRPCDDIIAYIRYEWPATLVQHDEKASQLSAKRLNRQACAANHPPGMPHPAQGPPPPEPAMQDEDIIVHPASVIALLRGCDYHDKDLLFPLFYALSCTTWQFGGPLLGHILAPLSSADTERLVIGIERLRTAHASFAAIMPLFTPPPMNPPHFCNAGVAQVWAVITRSLMSNAQGRVRQPLEDWSRMRTMVTAQYMQYPVCALCVGSITSQIDFIRQRLWAALPEYFELS